MSAEGYEAIKLRKSDEVSELLALRAILDEEVKMVIHNAETTGAKLYQPDSNRYLSKMRISNATFYVEYSVEGEAYTVHTAYSHRSEMEE